MKILVRLPYAFRCMPVILYDIIELKSMHVSDMIHTVAQVRTLSRVRLALMCRGDEQFVNEPHIGGGAPVVSSKGTAYFNDILGATVGAKRGRKYSVAALTAFGEGDVAFFTGNPPCSRPRAHISLPELPPRPRQVADRRPARLPRRLEFARVLQQQFGCRYGLARMLC